MNVRKAASPAAGSEARSMPASEAMVKELLAGAYRPAFHSMLLEKSAGQLVDCTKDGAGAL